MVCFSTSYSSHFSEEQKSLKIPNPEVDLSLWIAPRRALDVLTSMIRAQSDEWKYFLFEDKKRLNERVFIITPAYLYFLVKRFSTTVNRIQ
jgi:hypothetical protein